MLGLCALQLLVQNVDLIRLRVNVVLAATARRKQNVLEFVNGETR